MRGEGDCRGVVSPPLSRLSVSKSDCELAFSVLVSELGRWVSDEMGRGRREGVEPVTLSESSFTTDNMELRGIWGGWERGILTWFPWGGWGPILIRFPWRA